MLQVNNKERNLFKKYQTKSYILCKPSRFYKEEQTSDKIIFFVGTNVMYHAESVAFKQSLQIKIRNQKVKLFAVSKDE